MISVELNIFGLETNYGDFETISYFDNEKKAQEHIAEFKTFIYSNKNTPSTILSHQSLNNDGYALSVVPISHGDIDFNHHIFLLNDKTQLSIFFSYFENFDDFDKSKLKNAIELIYALASIQLIKNTDAKVVFQQSSTHYYLTLKQLFSFSVKSLESVLIKRGLEHNYIIDNKQMRFVFKKTSSISKNNNISKELKSSKDINSVKLENYTIYDFLDYDELDELEESLGDINLTLETMGENGIESDDVKILGKNLKHIGRILSRNNESFEIGLNVCSLGDTFIDNNEFIPSISKDIYDLCLAFNNDLRVWSKKLFFEGAPSLHFLDASIISSTTLIQNVIQTTNNEDDQKIENLDDIFDF